MAELPTQRDFEDYSAWSGRDVLTSDGDRLGAVELIFLDEATDLPEWVLVRLDDEGGTAFVPLAGAGVEERAIRVEPDRERIAAAPRIDTDDTLSVAEERRLYEHYGLAYSHEASSTVLPEGATASGASDTAPEPTEERPRLRKYVGAPVPLPASGDDADVSAPAADAAEAAATPSPSPSPDDGPTTSGTGVTDPVPTPLPPPAPTPLPPEGGYQREAAGEESGQGSGGGPLAALKRRPAIPVALASAIAGLIAVLAVRRHRR